MAAMNCQETQNQLFDYQDGILSASEREKLEHHLVGCEECRAAFANLKELGLKLSKQLRQSTQALTLDIDVKQRVLAALPGRATPRLNWEFRPLWRRWLVPWAAAACILMLALVIGSRFHHTPGLELKSAQAAALPAAVSATVPQVVTTRISKKEGNYVVDAFINRSQVVEQTFRPNLIARSPRN